MFGRRVAPKRLLLALAQARLAHAGSVLAPQELVGAGWPNERMRPEAARQRLRTAIWTLRKLGLEPVLLTRDEGYLLDPAVPLVWRDGAVGWVARDRHGNLRWHDEVHHARVEQGLLSAPSLQVRWVDLDLPRRRNRGVGPGMDLPAEGEPRGNAQKLVLVTVAVGVTSSRPAPFWGDDQSAALVR
jgi:hypothetical protein